MVDLESKFSLTVSELTPIVSLSKTRKLHEVERHLIVTPVASPVIYKQTEKLLMHRNIEVV